jgi:hypothetical protein
MAYGSGIVVFVSKIKRVNFELSFEIVELHGCTATAGHQT